jgi:hypothetical protein
MALLFITDLNGDDVADIDHPSRPFEIVAEQYARFDLDKRI